MEEPGPPVIVDPNNNHPHTHTVIFLHGRGDTAPNFAASLAHSRDSRDRTLAEALPSFRWVFPRARITPTAAFLLDKTSQWFDIWNHRNFAEREDLQAEGLADSVGRILGVLHEEADRLGGRWENIVLMGISQGAATSVHALLHLQLPAQAAGRLGAFLGFSCRLPFQGRTISEIRKILAERAPDSGWTGRTDTGAEVLASTPMLLEHCINDPLVPVEDGRRLRDKLRQYGADVVWKEYPDGGHWFNSPEGIDNALEFLQKVLDLDGPVNLSRDAMDTS